MSLRSWLYRNIQSNESIEDAEGGVLLEVLIRVDPSISVTFVTMLVL